MSGESWIEEEAVRYFGRSPDSSRAELREAYEWGARDAQLRANEGRERIARWMGERGYATGHGDTIEDLLVELEGHAKARAIAQHYGDDAK